jgi:tRNA-specific 2-thiouridylase
MLPRQRQRLLLRHRVNSKKVFVGLSGGVDSAVSAALLKREGYEVTGVFIKIQIPGYPCPAAADRRCAMRVAAHLDIPFIEIDLSKEYQEAVFNISIAEFAKGRTPNPDALCNREIKFGAFFDFAKSREADFIATGHYAQTASAHTLSQKSSGRLRPQSEPVGFQTFAQESVPTHLLAGADSNKDQSYFLWAVHETQLRHTLFPVGHMYKEQVRNLAAQFHLPNATRPDSQGLCFLGDISIPQMLGRELHPTPGDVLSEVGDVIGKHKGAQLYTLGERHGFELVSNTPHMPMHFVIAKDIIKNTITVSQSRFPQHARSTKIILHDANWIGTVASTPYMVRFRYRQALIPARLQIDDKKVTVTLEEPHYVPLGQSLVLYDKDRCLGGGTVDAVYLT